MSWARSIGSTTPSIAPSTGYEGHEPSDRIIYALTELADFSLLWHLIGWTKALRSERDVQRGDPAEHAARRPSRRSSMGSPSRCSSANGRCIKDERPHRLRVPLDHQLPERSRQRGLRRRVPARSREQASRRCGTPWPRRWRTAACTCASTTPATSSAAPPSASCSARRSERSGSFDERSRNLAQPAWVGAGMPLTFAITWDYRCPFARNLHDQVVEGLLDGADWDVTFVPFSLGQVHVAEGRDRRLGRTRSRQRLARVASRRRRARPIPRLVSSSLIASCSTPGTSTAARSPTARSWPTSCDPAGVDRRCACFAEIDGGEPLDIVRKEHEAAVADFDVWGVPTIIAGGGASFIRVMNDAALRPHRVAANRRAAGRSARRLARAQRVQAHVAQALRPSPACPSPAAGHWFTIDHHGRRCCILRCRYDRSASSSASDGCRTSKR